MKQVRNWMRFQLTDAQDPGAKFDATPARLEHAPMLAHLMDAAYTGTIDHEGETPEQCLEEMKGTIEGKYGSFIHEASFISFDGEIAASASLVTHWKGRPLLAFSMTAPDYQGWGRAGFLIRKSLIALKTAGYHELYLVVTEGNAPAEKLYRKLGFKLLGPSIPGRGNDKSLRMDRVDLAAEPLIQEILEAAPAYALKVDGVAPSPGDAYSTLTVLPPACTPEQKYVVVLRSAGLPIGVADIIQGYPHQGTAFIGLMVLREDYQRNGLGTAFYRKIETLITQELKCKKVRLAVVDTNPVIPFWEKMGFHLTEEARPHEGKKLSSIKRVMEKSLFP